MLCKLEATGTTEKKVYLENLDKTKLITDSSA